MRLLIDNALSPLIAGELRPAGHDAIHVRDISLAAANDEAILTRAAAEDRILVSADTDFGTLLTLRQAAKPSVVLLRLGSFRTPKHQAALLKANLPSLAVLLERGCVAVIRDGRIRVRSLPIGDVS